MPSVYACATETQIQAIQSDCARDITQNNTSTGITTSYTDNASYTIFTTDYKGLKFSEVYARNRFQLSGLNVIFALLQCQQLSPVT